MRKALVNEAQANDLEFSHLFKRMYFFLGLSSEDLGSLAELSGSEALDELCENLFCLHTALHRKRAKKITDFNNNNNTL